MTKTLINLSKYYHCVIDNLIYLIFCPWQYWDLLFMIYIYLIFAMLKRIKKNNLYICKQPLIMAYEGFESAPDNFSKFIYHLQPKTKALVWKLERILIKLYRQNMSLSFNQTCLNEGLLPNYTHICIYIYMCVCVCVCVYIYI